MDFDPAALGQLGGFVAVVWMFLKHLREESDRRAIQHGEMSELLRQNSELLHQNHEYLKLRNGKLDRALHDLTNMVQASQAQAYSDARQVEAKR